MNWKAFLLTGYRWFQFKVIYPLLIHFKKLKRNGLSHVLPEVPQSSRRRIWFHAASVGELESLAPLIHKVAEHQEEMILTIFSHSAEVRLKTMVQNLKNSSYTGLIFFGYAPWEGDWGRFIKALKPTLWVTAHYEAWPDLWISLQQYQIPLAVISVKLRNSLKFAKWCCQILIQALPRLFFFVSDLADQRDLLETFPLASCQVVGETRWDQMNLLMQKKSNRLNQLVDLFKVFPRPWGILGNAWLSDLKFLTPFLTDFEGTFWVVPHEVNEDSIFPMEQYLQRIFGQAVYRTQQLGVASVAIPSCLLVNEFGVLRELYSVMDWAFVGGGLGVGIHSTLEPAFYGLPIGVGPRGVHRFSETKALLKSGQLKILKTSEDLMHWASFLKHLSVTSKIEWQQQAQARLGATEKILDTLQHV